MSKINLLIL